MLKVETLVIGAVGEIGGAIASALLRAGHGVRALTPDLSAPAADELRRRGARLAWCKPDDRAGIAEAMAGATTVVAMTSALERGTVAETEHGLTFVDIARARGIGHFIYLSHMPAASLTGIAHFDSKHEIERYLRASGIPFTIVSPGFIMETLLRPPLVEKLRHGTLPVPLEPGRMLQLIARADVARFTRMVVQRQEEFAERRVCIASDEATATEMSAVLARVTGRRIDAIAPPDEPLDAFWTPAAFDWWNRNEGCARVAPLRSRYPDINWHTLDGWAHRQAWPDPA